MLKGGVMIKRMIASRLGVVFLLAVFMIQAAMVGAAPTNSTIKYFSVLRVVTAWVPFDSLSWEQSAHIKTTNNFQWFEATIYPSAPSAVHLYKFDNTFDPDKVFHLSRQDWVNYRESYRLMKVDIPEGLGAEEKSHLLREAFQQFFATMVKDTPSQHYGIRYSGHGSGSGGLFENQINPTDAQWLFEYVTSLIGKKIDFLDLGGNCSEGNTAVVSNFYPYFDYILASDLLIGGFNFDDWTIEKYNQTDPDYQYPLILTPDKTIRDSLSQLLDLFRLRWEYSRNNMIAGQEKQSLSLYKADAFETLAYSLGQELMAHPVNLGNYHYDLYTYIKSLGRSDMESQFLSFRTEYRSNKDFFPWDVDTNGLSIVSTDSVLPDFAIFPPYTPQLVRAGGTVVVDLLIRPRNSFNSPLTFAAQNLPPSSSVTFSPVFGVSPMHVSMSVITSATTPLETKTIVVTASGGGKTHTAEPQILVVKEILYLPIVIK